MTEPLSAAQMAASAGGTGAARPTSATSSTTSGLTRDNRVLWGGYDAVYYNGGRIREEHVVAPRDVREARGALLRHVPAARGGVLLARVGRRHRHVQPVLRVLRHRARRPGRLRGRVHGARRRRVPLRRPGAARQAAQPGFRTGAAVPGQQQAIALPAGAAALGRDPGDPRVDRPRRQERGPRDPWLRLLDRLGLGFDRRPARSRVCVPARSPGAPGRACSRSAQWLVRRLGARDTGMTRSQERFDDGGWDP